MPSGLRTSSNPSKKNREWNCGMMTGTEVCAIENEKDR